MSVGSNKSRLVWEYHQSQSIQRKKYTEGSSIYHGVTKSSSNRKTDIVYLSIFKNVYFRFYGGFDPYSVIRGD
jgi:hypothetical protein